MLFFICIYVSTLNNIYFTLFQELPFFDKTVQMLAIFVFLQSFNEIF
jgi:hypothetical protein